MLKRFLILCLLPILLCACTKNQQEEITFSSWGSVTEVGILNEIIKEYEKENESACDGSGSNAPVGRLWNPDV